MFQRKQNCCGFGEFLSLTVIPLLLLLLVNASIDCDFIVDFVGDSINGGVCGDSDERCGSSSFVFNDRLASSSRSNIVDRLAGICAVDEESGGVVDAQGDIRKSDDTDVLGVGVFDTGNVGDCESGILQSVSNFYYKTENNFKFSFSQWILLKFQLLVILFETFTLKIVL